MKKTTILILLTILVIVFFWLTGKLQYYNEIMQKGTNYNIVHIELAFTKEKAQDILNKWQDRMDIVYKSIYWDFLYLIVYPALLFLLQWIFSQGFNQKIFYYAKILPIIAGISDFLENITMLYTLHNITSAIPFITGIFASIKFTLILISMIFIIATGIYRVKFILTHKHDV